MHCNLLCTQGHWLLQTSFHGTAEPTMELVSFTPTNICSPDSSHLPPAREEHREAISHLPPAREEHREAQLTSASCQGGTQGSTVQCKPTLSTTAGNCTLWSHSQSMLIHTQFHDDIIEPSFSEPHTSMLNSS